MGIAFKAFPKEVRDGFVAVALERETSFTQVAKDFRIFGFWALRRMKISGVDQCQRARVPSGEAVENRDHDVC